MLSPHRTQRGCTSWLRILVAHHHCPGRPIPTHTLTAVLRSKCAVNAAAALTTGCLSSPEASQAALLHLPWLLELAPLQAVDVATGVPGLDAAEVLRLTRGRFLLPQLLLLQHAVANQGAAVRVGWCFSQGV